MTGGCWKEQEAGGDKVADKVDGDGGDEEQNEEGEAEGVGGRGAKVGCRLAGSSPRCSGVKKTYLQLKASPPYPQDSSVNKDLLYQPLKAELTRCWDVKKTALRVVEPTYLQLAASSPSPQDSTANKDLL